MERLSGGTSSGFYEHSVNLNSVSSSALEPDERTTSDMHVICHPIKLWKYAPLLFVRDLVNLQVPGVPVCLTFGLSSLRDCSPTYLEKEPKQLYRDSLFGGLPCKFHRCPVSQCDNTSCLNNLEPQWLSSVLLFWSSKPVQ